MLSNHGAGATLESPLDNEEIKPVNPQGNWPWLFIGRTNAKAPILWPPDAKSRLIRKDTDAGKDWRQKEKGMTEEEMVGWHYWLNGFPDSSFGKESTCNAGDPGSIPGSGRSSWEGIGYPLQYSGLENFMDCIVHGFTNSQTWLSDFHFLFFHRLNGHEFEQTPGNSQGQGSLACSSPWGCKESDTTEWLNWIKYVIQMIYLYLQIILSKLNL